MPGSRCSGEMGGCQRNGVKTMTSWKAIWSTGLHRDAEFFAEIEGHPDEHRQCATGAGRAALFPTHTLTVSGRLIPPTPAASSVSSGESGTKGVQPRATKRSSSRLPAKAPIAAISAPAGLPALTCARSAPSVVAGPKAVKAECPAARSTGSIARPMANNPPAGVQRRDLHQRRRR